MRTVVLFEGGKPMRTLSWCGLALVVWCFPGPASAAPDDEATVAQLQARLKKTEAELAAAKAENRALKEQLRRTETEFNEALAAQIEKAKDQARGFEEALRKLQNQLVAERDKAAKQAAAQDALLLESRREAERSKDDATQLRKALAVEADRNAKLLQDRTNAIQDKVKADLDARAANDARQRLEQQVQELSREVARLKGQKPPENPPGKNPPAQHVEGMVLMVDEKSGLMRINIGSDAGLAKGHTLEVFRLGKTPGASKYLGVVRVLDVTAKESVVQPVGRLASPAQAGDNVADRIAP
jgi:hypothetical protein